MKTCVIFLWLKGVFWFLKRTVSSAHTQVAPTSQLVDVRFSHSILSLFSVRVLDFSCVFLGILIQFSIIYLSSDLPAFIETYDVRVVKWIVHSFAKRGVVGSITSPQHFHWHAWKVTFLGHSKGGQLPRVPSWSCSWPCQPCCWVEKAYIFPPPDICVGYGKKIVCSCLAVSLLRLW